MQLYKSLKFVDVFFDSEHSLVKVSWTKDSLYLSHADAENNTVQICEICNILKPKFYLADDLEKRYIYTAERQKRVAESLTKTFFTIGLKKFALIMPKDTKSYYSTDAVLEEGINIGLIIKFKVFSNETQAMLWLFDTNF